MKKFIIIILSIILILSFTLSVSAEAVGESIEVFRNIIKLEVNGENVDADNFVLDGVAYVPLKKVGELLNKNVGWNSFTNVATIDDMSYELESLSKLLPTAKGFEWIYEGFAEYGHKMKLDSIVDESEYRDYNISGEVTDPSDGDSGLDGNIIIKYSISNNKLVQTKTESAMLDSKFDNITLIQTPLVAGTYWEEDLVDKNGLETSINSYIEKVETSSDNKKEYTIRYDDVNSDYYEIRKMKEGIGIVSFEKLLELEDSSFPVSYFLYEDTVTTPEAEKINVKLYFPDKNAEKLQLEIRKVDVFNKGVARASILALIDGSATGLNPSIPGGTKFLNIYIKNGVAFVDFSKEFISNHSGGSAGELMTLYSITNTLTEFKSITGVQILVEGKSGKTLGNMVLDKPLKRNPDLIKKSEKIDVKLYFPDKNAEKLQLETRKLDVFDKGVARASILALMNGPSKDLSPSIPSGTKLLNIYIKNKIAFVDFSKEFISNHSGGSAGELMTLYSITNTLTEFKSITGVQILVEGKSGKTLGNIILDKPLKRNLDLIKK